MEKKYIGAYQVIRPLARGGMGETLIARSPDGELVVLKTLLDHLVGDNEAQRCFSEEIRIAGRLDHPNVVRFIEVIQDGPQQVLVLEYVDGCSARDLILDARANSELLDPAQACAIVADAAQGLHYAHSLADERGNPLGLIHRDVSPANILISRQGEVKLIDFGVAKAWDAEGRTATGVVKGKVGYMSPEHTRCEPLDARSDVFSMGTVMWELLVCDRLFVGDGPVGTAYKVLDAPIPKPSSRRQDIPAPIDAICMRALERKLDQRTQSARELEQSLQRWLKREKKTVDLGALVRERFPIGLPEASESAPTQVARPIANSHAGSAETQTVGAPIKPGQLQVPAPPGVPQMHFPNSQDDLENNDLSSTYFDQHIELDMQGLRRRRLSWRIVAVIVGLLVAAGLSVVQLYFPQLWQQGLDTVAPSEAFYRYQDSQGDAVIVNDLAVIPPEKRAAAQRLDLSDSNLQIEQSDPGRAKTIRQQLRELDRKLGRQHHGADSWQQVLRSLAAPLIAIVIMMVLLWWLSRVLRDGFLRWTLRLLILFVGFSTLYRVTTVGVLGQPGLRDLHQGPKKAPLQSLSPVLRDWVKKQVESAGAGAAVGDIPAVDMDSATKETP